jgi:hypothetical protein
MPRSNGGGELEADTFKQVLLQSLDSGLASLGEHVRQVIYFHMERNCGLKREQIPENMEQFHQALVTILGQGSTVVEKLITKHIHQSIGLDSIKYEDIPLLDCVAQLKQKTQQPNPSTSSNN